jgi:hypothetical protein
MAGQLSRFFLTATATARVTIFAACATGIALVSPARAQTPPDATAPPGATTPPAAPDERQQKPPKLAKAVESPAFDNVRKALDALTPAQRKRFQENFIRWSNLAPEEKKSLRDREEARKKVVAQEVDTVLKDFGLDLDSERRELFAKRYSEERRKIEEQLRKEAAEKRKPLVRDMVARLRQEFAAPGPLATPTPLPATAQPN